MVSTWFYFQLKFAFLSLIIIITGTNRTYTLANLNSFNVEKTHSYFCANVTVPKENGDGELKVSFTNIQLQAFMDKKQNGNFSSGM